MPLSDDDRRAVDKVARIVSRAESMLFITGAGVSAESGLPTYRGIGGLYDNRETDEGVPIEVALSGSHFQARPEITWKHLLRIARASRGVTFNRAHEVIALLEKRLERVWTFTQNVDGLHRAAGSRNVIDIHGDMSRLVCTNCDFRTTITDVDDLPPLPTCPNCGAVARPDVVLFEEPLPVAKLRQFQEEFARGFDIVFSIGTSSLFPYIVEPVVQARILGIPTVEINPSQTEVSGLVDYRIRAGAAESLNTLWNSLD